MNDMRNRLAAWLQMYDQGGMGDSLRQQNASHSGFNPSPVDLNGARMMWAQQMMDRESQQAPDYFNFGEEQQQAAPDQRVSPIRGPLNIPQAPMKNRLLAMMGGNYGR